MLISFKGVDVGEIGLLMKAADCHQCGGRTSLMYGLFPPDGGDPCLPTCANCVHTDVYFGGLLDGVRASVLMTKEESEHDKQQEHIAGNVSEGE